MELVKAYPLNDAGDIFAVWRDEIGTFTVIHDAQGHPATLPGPGVNPPRLTAVQLQQAQTPPRHPAYDLADKISGKLANRAQKAAEMVEAGLVVLNGEQTATVKAHKVNGRSCDCDWQKFHPGDPCSHYLAVRMARALSQPVITVHVDSEADKERASEERARMNQERKIIRQAEAHQANRQQQRQFQQWCETSADAGRAYVLAAAGAGRVAATSDSRLRARQQQARQYERNPEVEALKKRVLAELGIGGN